MSHIYRVQSITLHAAIPVADYLCQQGFQAQASNILTAAEACRPFLPRVSQKTQHSLMRRIAATTESLRTSLDETAITPLSMVTFLETLTCQAWQWMPAIPLGRKKSWSRFHYYAAELHEQLDPRFEDTQAYRDGLRMALKLLEASR